MLVNLQVALLIKDQLLDDERPGMANRRPDGPDPQGSVDQDLCCSA